MSKDGRGLHFLVGIGVIWLFWRLLITGVLHDVGFLAFQTEQAFRGPGAIVVAFILEAIIAIGAVSVLLVSGLWDAAYTFGVLLKDAFGMGTEYLAAWQAEREPVEEVETQEPAESKPVGEPVNPLIGAMINTREQIEIQQRQIQQLSEQIAAMGAKSEVVDGE